MKRNASTRSVSYSRLDADGRRAMTCGSAILNLGPLTQPTHVPQHSGVNAFIDLIWDADARPGLLGASNDLVLGGRGGHVPNCVLKIGRETQLQTDHARD